MDQYRLDNTTGLTQDELDALNAELAHIIRSEYEERDGELNADDLHEIMKRHSDEVARR